MMRTAPATVEFGPETVVADALAMHPKVRWVFAAYQLGGCNGCERASDETLEQLAAGYGISLDRLLRDLNGLIADQNFQRIPTVV